jgi:hypothetical protein
MDKNPFMSSTAMLTLQIVVACILGILLSMILYSKWFHACCMTNAGSSLDVLYLPAVLVAALIGGGIHGATHVDFTIGLIVELLMIVAIFRLLYRILRRRRI